MKNGAFSYSGAELDALGQARNYYCWILRQFLPYVGQRTIEVGVGGGTFSELRLAQTAIDLSGSASSPR